MRHRNWIICQLLQGERENASKILKGPSAAEKPKVQPENKRAMVEKIRKALYASKIISYAQGFMLLREAASNYGWKLNYGGIALMWRGGCIIRSAFLGKIKLAFDQNPELVNPNSNLQNELQCCSMVQEQCLDSIHSRACSSTTFSETPSKTPKTVGGPWFLTPFRAGSPPRASPLPWPFTTVTGRQSCRPT